MARKLRSLKEIRAALKFNIPDIDLDKTMDLIERIQELKIQKNAIVLGHNYMTPDVFYGTSDIIGDSLYLSREAAVVDSDIILFNGVYFMAETAAVLNPGKKVLIPDPEAGCSLVEDITPEDVLRLKEQYPGAPVVTYVNSSAAVKAVSDICCTSANALKIVESLKSDTVIFIPDKYLAGNVASKTSKKIIPWEKGRCIVHERYTADQVAQIRKDYDDILVIAHPECDISVTQASDFSGSTSQMEEMVRKSPKKNIFLVTECSMKDNLKHLFPDRNFISYCQSCPYMKLITLDKVLHSLETETTVVTVPEEIRKEAKKSVDRMLEVL